MGFLSLFKKEPKEKTLDSNDLGWETLSLPYVADNKNFKDSLQETTVFACITYLAQDVAKVPLNIFKEKGRHREKAIDHPLYKAFKYGPNEYQTSYDYIEFLMWSLLRKGNCYSFIFRDKNQNVESLYPLSANRVQVYEAPNGQIYYGISPAGDFDNAILEKFQNYMNDELTQFLIPARYIWHVKDIPTGNGTKGLSRLDAQASLIKYSLKQREFSNSQLDNRSAPSLVLSTDKELKKETQARLSESWDKKFMGVSKAFKTAVLHSGLKPHPVKVEYGDLELTDQKKLSHHDIARLFRVPLGKLMEREGSSYNNLETENQAYVSDSLMPFFEKFERSIDKFLLVEGAGNYCSEFDVSRLLRGDSKSRAEFYRTSRQWGIHTINEVREIEGLEPVEGGDVIHMPINMEDINNPRERKGAK